MLSTGLRVVLVTLSLTSFGSAASARTYGLVHPRVCLAGHWGKPVQEWRVQMGVFQDDSQTRIQGIPEALHAISSVRAHRRRPDEQRQGTTSVGAVY